MKKYFRALSFRSKITLLCISIVLAALVTFHTISMTLFSDTFMQSTQQHTTDTLKLINQNINLMLKRTETYIRLLSIDTEMQSLLNEYKKSAEENIIYYQLPSAISNITSGVFSPTSEIIGCVITVDNTIIYPSDSYYINSIQEGLSEDHLNSTLYSSKLEWQTSLFTATPFFKSESDVAFRYKEKQNVIAVSKKIVDRAKGYTLGVITLLLNENAFSSIFENELGNYYLLNTDAEIISCTNKDELFASGLDVLNISSKEFEKLKTENYITISDNDHRYMLTLVHNTPLNCDLVLYTDLTLLTKEQTHVNILMIAVLIITIIIIFVTVLMTSSAITKPITTLLEVMQNYSDHCSVRAPENISGEMGVLAKSFNQLLDKVEENIQHIEKIQKKHRKLELKILQEQIQPHFLYNALQTAASLIQLKQYDKSMESLCALSDFYKYSLSSGKEVITLGEELVILQSYLKIQHIRYLDYFDFSIKVEDELLDLLIPKLTLQPLVENSIYHGLKLNSYKGVLMVNGYKTDQENVIEVIDSGVGMTPEQINKLLTNDRDNKSSFGLKNVMERLQILYGAKFSFEIDSAINEYTSVTLRIADTEQEGEFSDV